MRCTLSTDSTLSSLVGAIKRSPIFVRLSARALSPAEWARIRTSTQVDAFVLAWIASHVPRRRHKHPGMQAGYH
jgi:hypothetical protein